MPGVVFWTPRTLLFLSVTTAASAIGCLLLDLIVQKWIVCAHRREE
jgi:hypothetical protein